MGKKRLSKTKAVLARRGFPPVSLSFNFVPIPEVPLLASTSRSGCSRPRGPVAVNSTPQDSPFSSGHLFFWGSPLFFRFEQARDYPRVFSRRELVECRSFNDAAALNLRSALQFFFPMPLLFPPSGHFLDCDRPHPLVPHPPYSSQDKQSMIELYDDALFPTVAQSLFMRLILSSPSSLVELS